MASETNVVSKMIAGHGPHLPVFRINDTSARTQKVSLNEFCTTGVNPGMNLLRNTLVKVLQGSKTLKHKQLYSHRHCEQYENVF